MITREQIQEAVNEVLGEDGPEYFDSRKKSTNGLSFEQEEQVGGEGQGETYYVVYKVTNMDSASCFIKFDAYYASYDGADFGDNEFDIVEPYMKQVRDWKAVK